MADTLRELIQEYTQALPAHILLPEQFTNIIRRVLEMARDRKLTVHIKANDMGYNDPLYVAGFNEGVERMTAEICAMLRETAYEL